jgi:hypothetical protein
MSGNMDKSPVPHVSVNCHSPKQCRAECNLYKTVNSEADQRDDACKSSCYYRNQSVKTVPGDSEILQSFSAPGNILANQRSHDQSISSGTSKSGGKWRAGGN